METNKLDARKCALIVVDIQNFFMAAEAPCELAPAREMLPRLNNLIENLKTKGCLIVYTRMRHDNISKSYQRFFPDHYDHDGKPLLRHGSHWFQLYDDLVRAEDYLLDKDRFSAFFQTELELVLRAKGIETVIIAGLASNVCCESTARDAAFRDFEVIFLSDCNVTLDEEMHQSALRNISLIFGLVITSDELNSLLD